MVGKPWEPYGRVNYGDVVSLPKIGSCHKPAAHGHSPRKFNTREEIVIREPNQRICGMESAMKYNEKQNIMRNKKLKSS